MVKAQLLSTVKCTAVHPGQRRRSRVEDGKRASDRGSSQQSSQRAVRPRRRVIDDDESQSDGDGEIGTAAA
eukprot:3560099-Pleurochrysis_carterae.AAC.1